MSVTMIHFILFSYPRFWLQARESDGSEGVLLTTPLALLADFVDFAAFLIASTKFSKKPFFEFDKAIT